MGSNSFWVVLFSSGQAVFVFVVDLHDFMEVLFSSRVELLWLFGLCVRFRVLLSAFLRTLSMMAFGVLTLLHGGLALLLHRLSQVCQG